MPAWAGTPQATIALELTADGGFAPTQQRSNLVLVVTGFHECVNLVTFLLGKLRLVSHRAPLSLRLEGAVMLPWLALLPSN